MSTFAKNTKATVIPCLRYRDAAKAIDWLCATFGFDKQAVYANPDGTIAHAQLTFGNGMIMLGSVLKHATEWGRLIKQPDEIGGAETQSAYVSSPTPMLFTLERRLRERRSSSKSKTKTMAGAVSVVMIWKATFGTSAPTTPGDAQHRAPSKRARCAWR